MYDFISEHRNTPEKDRYTFEGRELWCNVHKTRDERDAGVPMAKAVDCCKALIGHITNNPEDSEKVVSNLTLHQIIFQRKVIATLVDNELVVDAENLPKGDPNVIRTLVPETIAAYNRLYASWKAEVEGRKGTVPLQQ